MYEEFYIKLKDDEWPLDYIDHDRQIVRAIVFDSTNNFYSREATSQVAVLARIFGDCREGQIPRCLHRNKFDAPYACIGVFDLSFYFVRAFRDDDFGKAAIIETSGGGVEPGEKFPDALRRELREELGAEVEIICKLGVVEDYYNLIHRHNVNHYYLCKVISFGETNLTEDEKNEFHLSALKLGYQEAVREYKRRADTKLGRLIAKRELPVLQYAKKVIDGGACSGSESLR